MQINAIVSLENVGRIDYEKALHSGVILTVGEDIPDFNLATVDMASMLSAGERGTWRLSTCRATGRASPVCRGV